MRVRPKFVWMVLTAVSLQFTASAENWPGFEGLFHQSNSKVDVNVSSGNMEVKWDKRIVPQWTFTGYNSSTGAFFSKNLTYYYGNIGLCASTDTTYSQGNPLYCHATVLDADTGDAIQCIYTNEWWGTKWAGADALETAQGEQVVAWDTETGIFHLNAGGDQCSHRSYDILSNKDSFGGTTAVAGSFAWDHMQAYAGFVSSRGTYDFGSGAESVTRNKEDAYSGNPPLGYDEWDAGTIGTTSWPANRSSYFDVQPGSPYLITTNGGGHTKACGVTVANKGTGRCANVADQSNGVYDIGALGAGMTPCWKRGGAQLVQGDRIYYMGPWDSGGAGSTGTSTQDGMRLTCIRYTDQDLQTNDGYNGDGYKETASPTELVFDYQLETAASEISWQESDNYFQNKAWFLEDDGTCWAAWKTSNTGNYQLVKAAESASATYNLSVGSSVEINYCKPNIAYCDDGDGYIAFYLTNGEDVPGSWTLTSFDIGSGSEQWTYDLGANYSNIPQTTSLADYPFSRMIVSGKYAIVAWIDTSGTNCALKAVAVDITAATAPATPPTPFSYEFNAGSGHAVPSATYPETRLSDLMAVDGVIYALVYEDTTINPGQFSRYGYVDAQRIIAIGDTNLSDIDVSMSVSPDSGAGKIVAVCDATGTTTTAPSISSYEWDFDYDHLTFDVDGSGKIVANTFSSTGEYTVGLRVTDSTGHSEIRVANIEVTASSSGTLTYENGDGIDDTFAQKSTSTWRPATSAEVQIHGATLANESCGILKFDVSSIPGGSTIDSATLQMYTFNRSGSGSIYAGTFPNDALTIAGACWDYIDLSSTAWSSATPVASVSSAIDTVAQPGAIGWVAFDVSSAIQDWVDGSETNNGIGIWASDTVDDRFHSTDNSTDAALSPKVTINYSGAAPTEDVYAVHPGSAASESYPSGTPVTVNWGTEGPIDNVDLYYSTASDSGPWTSIASGQTNDGTSSWDASALAGSATVWVRVTKAGDTSTAAVSANSFEIEATTTYTVSGTVSISGDSTATNGVTIALKNGPVTVDSQVLDGTGNYSLDAPDGSYSYQLTGPGFTYAVTTPNPNSVTVSGGAVVQNVEATATTQSTHTISGTLSGSSSSGVSVYLMGDSEDETTSDGSGNYSFTVADGSYIVSPDSDGYQFTPQSEEVTVSGSNVTGVDFVSAQPAAAWGGNDWADPEPYMGLINSTIKTNLRSIWTAGQAAGRVAGRMGQIGDSITNSQAYFANTMGGGTGTNETGHDWDPVWSWLCEGNPGWNCWYRNTAGDVSGTPDDWRKGGTYWCNQSGWRVSNAVAAGHPANVITNSDMSWVVIMYGTNDIDVWSGDLTAASNTWKTSYKAFVQGFIDDDVIPVVSTIPPEHAYAPDGGTGDERYLLANERIIETADELNIPYIDFYGWIVDKQPGNAWDGDYHGENRLISDDGTHPSNSTANFSELALTWNGGYRARTMLTMAMAEKVKAIVFDDGSADSTTLRVSTVALVDAEKDAYYGPVQLRAWGGTEPYVWSEVGSNLPAGLTITAAGEVSGTATAAGEFTITVKVTDDNSDIATAQLNLTVDGSTSVTLEPTKDSYVDASNATTNYGSDTLIDSQGNNNDTSQRITLAEFDLSGIPAGSTINTAIIRVYCNNETAASGGQVSIQGVNDSWTEAGVTYNTTDGSTQWMGSGNINENGSLDGLASATATLINHPSTHGDYTAGQFPGDDWDTGDHLVQFDVASLVEDWIDGTRDNYGLAICTTGKIPPTNYGYFFLAWQSKENSNPPQLIVNYSPPVGDTPPTLTADTVNNNVDNDIVISFTDDAAWRGQVTAVKWGATTLDGANYTLASGSLTINQGVIQTAAIQDVTVEANGYTDAVVSQTVLYGAATQLGVNTNPGGPASNGGPMSPQPVIEVRDQYGNVVANSTASVTAAKLDANDWTLGGSAVRSAVDGVATYSGLTATNNTGSSIADAQMRFTSGGLTAADSGTFTIPPTGAACDVYVSPTGNDTTGDGSYGNPYATIAHAISVASGGDIIGVLAGTYTEAGLAVDKQLTITGEGAKQTIVQAAAAYDTAGDRVFTVTANADVALVDMTIRYGKSAASGGGVRVRPTSAGSYNYTIDGCEIIDNITTVADNWATGGGGLYVSVANEAGLESSVLITDSTISGNLSGSRGGGMFMYRDNNPTMTVTLENCTISGNTASGTSDYAGGGISEQNTPLYLYNCAISANNATGGAGGVGGRYGSLTARNSIIAGNDSAAGVNEDVVQSSTGLTESYNVIGINDGSTFTSGSPNANDSYVGTSGTPVDADLAALADNGGETRTMAPNAGSPALRLIPRGGSSPYYNDSPTEDQRGYWIDRPTDDLDYLSRTCGPYWDAASPTPARGFRGWVE